MPIQIPDCAWTISLNEGPLQPGRPRSYPMGLEPSMVWPNLAEVPIDLDEQFWEMLPCPPTKPIDDGFNQGIPIGGLGCGSIGRGYKGDFARWHLRSGAHEYHPSLPNQFHLRIEGMGRPFLQTLNPRNPKGKRLSSWSWGMRASRATYHALFPRAWTTYNFRDAGIEATCQQLSPVIGHNYQESSYPVGVFSWRIANVADKSLDVSLMFTWENAVSPTQPSIDCTHSLIESSNPNRLFLNLRQERIEAASPVSFGMGVEGSKDTELTSLTRFNTESRGRQPWRSFKSNGVLVEGEPKPTKKPHKEGGALCAKAHLEPEESTEIVFALSWDIPIIQFGEGRRWYKYYTRFYGTSGEYAVPLVKEALDNWRAWEDGIVQWQRPIVDSDRPMWLKTGLLNELYFLVDSSSAWVVGEVDDKVGVRGLGHFGYLECFEYPYMNTYDVLYYASFATLMNWPELDNSIQRDFANAIDIDDDRPHTLLVDKKVVPRKPKGAVPHDLGMPQEDPWYSTNAYAYLDCGRWKDLNSKFVLQVYRNFAFTKDKEFLKYCWPAVKLAMEYVDAFDKDLDGIPENEGFPDQTYDNWMMEGPSAYCGSLYLGAAQAMIAISRLLDDESTEKKYRMILESGQRSFNENLWNSRYYDFDSGNAKHHDSIMADQLAGQWYMHVCDLPDIVPRENAISALQTIYNFNVLRFQLGQIGAVNGMRPDGTPDNTCAQSSEVWTGTTYALAAFMIHLGLVEQGLKTALGIYNMTYKERGYWFRTPEAWTEQGNFRASMYMRPLSIWAIEHALQSRE
ncbi:MAG: non-lysosomal glucosylceramidase [Candidatus Thorarchaeota archaeon]